MFQRVSHCMVRSYRFIVLPVILFRFSCCIVHCSVLSADGCVCYVVCPHEQNKWGYSADVAGRIVGVPDLLSALSAPVWGALIDRYGLRAFALMGNSSIIITICAAVTLPYWSLSA